MKMYQDVNDKILALHGWQKVEKREWFEEQTYTDGNVVWRHRDMPNYSGDMRAAWELVTEMIAAGCFVVVQSGNGIDDNDNDNMFTCVVYNDILLTKSGDTAPLAICEAYMAWKRKVTDEDDFRNP